MLCSQWNRVPVEHMQCGEERQTPGPVAVVRLSAIGDTLIAAKSLSLLVEAGLDPVFFTYGASLDVARLVPGLRWVAVVTKDGSFRVESLKDGSHVERYHPSHVLDLQGTARSRRVIRRLRKSGAVQVWCASKRSVRRLWLMTKARLCLDQRMTRQSLPGEDSTWYVHPASEFRVVHGHREALRKLLQSLGVEGALSGMPNAFPAPPRFGFEELMPQGYVVIFPGASAPLKTWGEDRFVALARELRARTSLEVAVLGGPDEAAVAAAICAKSPGGMHDLAGKLTLAQSLALIANAAYVVTGDSFPAHACDLFRVPATLIFGATSPAFGFVPEAPCVTLRYASLGCSPCTRHGRGRCRFQNMKCMESVTVEAVLGDLRKVLPGRFRTDV